MPNLLLSSRPLRSAHWQYGGRGYIAGEAEGIVTVNGQPASRRIYLFARSRRLRVATAAR